MGKVLTKHGLNVDFGCRCRDSVFTRLGHNDIRCSMENFGHIVYDLISYGSSNIYRLY